MRRLPGLVLCLFLAGCRLSQTSAAPAHDGPIVLVTFDSLRADVVGQPGVTPNLDALIREADWSGRAIASSSWGLPSMASLFTGLRPWQHRVLRAEDRIPQQLITLPEALQARGYETFGFMGEPMYSKEAGFGQGFDLLTRLGKGTEAGEKLRSAGPGQRFVWVHFSEPQAPYYRRPKFVARLGLRGRELPYRVLPHQLAPFFDPAVPLPPELQQRFRTMYRLNVAWADDRLGKLLKELRDSGQWERTLLVVTATHGEEFGEKGQILNGGNLGRQLIEVPLVIKLPSESRHEIAAPRDQRVATSRLWATLVEAAGGEVPPAQSPSLFRPTPGGAPDAVLSELYLINGTNRFSLVQGNDQLLWETRFAPPEPEYYRARLALMSRGNARIARAEITERPGQIFRRLYAGFLDIPPLTGLGAPRLILERWEGKGGSRLVEDPRRQADMARTLARTWNEFFPAELTPRQEAREWYNADSP